VTKDNWGVKRLCPSCGTRFYDLNKNPATCPKCGKSHDVNVVVKTRRGKKSVVVDADEPLAKAKAKAEAKQKIKKPVKEIEDINLEEFEDIETLDTEEEIEELEEIEDIESIEGIEEVEDVGKGESDDALTIEDDSVGNDGLIDEVEEDAEEDEDDAKPKAGAKAKKKGKK
jgi:uncharacterized protein (TIGR02300 family)